MRSILSPIVRARFYALGLVFWGGLAVCASACGGPENQPKDPPGGAAASAAPALKINARSGTRPVTHPNTEEAVIEAAVVAMEARDIDGLKRVVSPELGADLARLHFNDPNRFWTHGEAFSRNFRTGMTICHRQEATGKLLLCFGNGKKERVQFTRRRGQLLLEEL